MAAFHDAKRPLFEKAAEITVEVEQEKGSNAGTGMVITATGLVLTAAHIFEDEKTAIVRRCRITDKSWRRKSMTCYGRYMGDVIYTHQKLDIAIIQLRRPPRLSIARFNLLTVVEIGDELFRTGRDQGDECLVEGYVYEVSDKRPEFRISMSGPPGSSGSPVFTDDGTVVGMALAGADFDKNPVTAHFSSVIPIVTVWHAIKDQPFMRSPKK